MIDKFRIMIMNNKTLKYLLRPLYKTFQKPFQIKQNYIFRRNGLEALEKLESAFSRHDILFWLEFGTLLGAIRENNFIKHDLDIDIGLFLDNDTLLIEEIMIDSGFVKVQQIEIEDGTYGMEQSYLYKGVTIDLFYFTKRESSIYCHVFTTLYDESWSNTKSNNLGLIPYEHDFPYKGFKYIEFLGMKVRVPLNEHEHLIAQYGENYMIKNAKWNPYKMATNKTILEFKKGYLK